MIFYSTYFAVVVYLQSRIPVVVEPRLYKRRSGVDLEWGSTDSLSSLKEKMKEIFRTQGSSTDTSVPPRPLVLPTLVHPRQSFPPQPQSNLPNAPRRQSTMPSLPHTVQQPFRPLPPVPSRHHSLPAFKHGNGPHLRPLLTLSVPRPLAADAYSPHPQSPSSYSYSTPSPANPQNQFFSFQPSVTEVQSPRFHRGTSGHLSMMPLSSPSGETQNAEGGFTTRPTRARLTKPLPTHLL